MALKKALQETEMPINQWIKHIFDPEKVAVLERAFEYALSLADRTDALTGIVASKIIEVEASGITGAEEIAKAAIKRLGLPGAPRSSESQGT
jgi:hypothetical protein